MNPKIIKLLNCFFVTLLVSPGLSFAETVGVFFDPDIAPIKFGAEDVKTALESKGFTVEGRTIDSLTSTYPNKKVVITLASDADTTGILNSKGGAVYEDLGEQAYGLSTTTGSEKSYWVIGGDTTGAMYGALQVAENIQASGFADVYNFQEAPYMENRGMKLNMPLDRRVPTYVGGWSSTSTGLAIPHVWDMSFWETLIDQQARNRYNVLSIWVHHPFPALVKLPDYPKASLPDIQGFDGFSKDWDHEKRVAFWTDVIDYAHSRGMKLYFFNWNIHLEYAKDQYPEITQNKDNEVTKDYMYKSMYALLETYPKLDGFGISAGDGMMWKDQGFGRDRELKTQWTWETMGKAVEDFLKANPDREFNLIHRGIGTNPQLVDEKFAPIKELPNAELNFSHKYSQAHMYATTTPRWSGTIRHTTDLGLESWLTVRNDDYFYINWGDPQFVRDYMAGIWNKENIVGMYIGSDTYTPTRAYFSTHDSVNGMLEVERRWYMEMLWGRLSYNPDTSDAVFKNMLARRFPGANAENLFEAWSLASRSLPKATELVMGTWALDFHWYPEGSNSEERRCTGFRTVFDFANMSEHPNAKDTTVAKGSELCDIPTSAAGNCEGKKSSYTVADEMQADSARALDLIGTIRAGDNHDLQLAINNVEQMAYLGLYYAHKIRGATFLSAGQVDQARDEVGSAYCHWMSYTRSMEQDYIGTAFRSMAILPDWRFADEAVLKDYTDLGGVGIPSCE